MAILKDGKWVQDPNDPHPGSLLDHAGPEVPERLARQLSDIRAEVHLRLPPCYDERARICRLIDDASQALRHMAIDLRARPVKPRTAVAPPILGFGWPDPDVPDPEEVGYGSRRSRPWSPATEQPLVQPDPMGGAS